MARVADGADVDGEPVGLVAAVSELAGVDPQMLDGARRVDLIRGLGAVLAMAAGEQQRGMAAVAEATMGFGLTGMDARHEVGAALRLAPGTAAERTEVALALTGRLADTLAAVRRGEVSWRQAADLAVAVAGCPTRWPRGCRPGRCPGWAARTAAESRRAVRAAVVAADPRAPPSGPRRPSVAGASSAWGSPTPWRPGGCPCRPRPRPTCGPRPPAGPGPLGAALRAAGRYSVPAWMRCGWTR